MNALDLQQKLGPEAWGQVQPWLETSESLTELMRSLAPIGALQHSLESVGWTEITVDEQAIWPGFVLGDQAWRRCISFSVDGVHWLQAEVLIPKASLQGAAGIALQYCGAQSLGPILFQDPTLQRSSLGYSCESTHAVTRHGLFEFFSRPVVISECFSQALWQQSCWEPA